MGFIIVPIHQVPEDLLKDFALRTWTTKGAETMLSKWWLRNPCPVVNTVMDDVKNRLAGIVVAIPSYWPLPDGSHAKTLSICEWYVAPDYGGRGLGKRLVTSFNDAVQCYNAFAVSKAAIHNFKKLGWVGPFHTKLFLLPFPGFSHNRKPVGGLAIRSFVVTGDALQPELSDALDVIESERPAKQIRRRRKAADWRMHLSVRSNRIQHFHILMRGRHPVGAFVLRRTDGEAGSIYRRLGLHYVTDIVLNTGDDTAVGFLIGSIGAAAPSTAGALLLCTNSNCVSSRLKECGWLSENSVGIGSRLGAKAPLYMLGGGLAKPPREEVVMTFTDSDIDFGI